MISTKAYSRIIGLLLGAAILVPTLPAQAIVLDATEDIWIRQNSPNTVYQNDFISVWGTPSTDIRYGAVEFDLSSTVGQTLNSVYLNLWDPGSSRSQTQPIVQQAYVLTQNLPPSIADYTWAEYETWDAPNEAPFASLGSYNIPVGDYEVGYNASEFGSQADIALLESVRDNNAGRVVFILKATDGQRDWMDIESGTPPQLVFNQAPPIFGDLNNDGVVDENDLAVITDPANWLQNVPPGTRGNISGDGRVDLNDFHAFKQVFQQHQPGTAMVVPEPGSLTALLLVAGCSLFLRQRLDSQR